LKFLTVSILLLGPNLVAQENRLIVNADQGKEIVSRHIYGHFAEHLGRCIYEGFWVGEGSPIPNVRGIRTDVMSRYATYVRNTSGNRVYRIGCGSYGENFDWTEVLMRHEKARYMMQGLSYHYYTVFEDWGNKGSATEFDEYRWFGTLKKALEIEGLIDIHTSIMDRYDPKKRIGMIVDEWGNWFDVEPGTNVGFLYQQNTLRDAISAAVNLNIFNNHCDRITMANIAQTVNVLQAMILTQGEKMVLTPTYNVFEMYKVHQDATLLPVHITCPDYIYQDESIPALHASASIDDKDSLHISICNLDPNRGHMLTVDCRGASIQEVSGWVLTASDITAHNTFEQPDAVRPAAFTGFRTKKNTIILDVPPKAVIVLRVR